MRQHISTIILVLILIVGVSLLLYPTVSDYWNEFHQSKAISGYVDAVENMGDEKAAELLEQARAYNERLLTKSNRWELSDEELSEYENTLDITGTGIMAYVEIPGISVSLPIYHGTDDSILQIGVGHIEGSSLPVGGESTHSALSGHRGLKSAKLFTDIDQMTEGDVFMIHVLNETMTYQVDQIRIVLPEELNDLKIETGEDYCTLITCTPYGVNTHRLLVRGHRIANSEAKEIITSEAVQVNKIIVYVAFGVIILFIYVILYRIVKYRILINFR
jgi:sortase A